MHFLNDNLSNFLKSSSVMGGTSMIQGIVDHTSGEIEIATEPQSYVFSWTNWPIEKIFLVGIVL